MRYDLRVLWFNHRDLTHPEAGGAELYIQEIGKRLAREGHNVTVFCENYAGGKAKEQIDGIWFVRKGGPAGLHVHALLANVHDFDVVIDDMAHGVPFYTPLIAKGTPVCAMMMHWHDIVFLRELRFPKTLVARIAERSIPILYRRVYWVAISQATKRELVRRGFPSNRIAVISPGVDIDLFRPGSKSSFPLIVCVSRLKKYKNVHHLLLAFRKVLDRHPMCKLVVLGTGSWAEELKRMTKSLGLLSEVTFDERICLGGKSLEAKINLLQRAWMAVVPSSYEGFSLATLEAMACGTPVVTTDIPSLMELVNGSKAGLTFRSGDVQQLARCMLELIENQDLRRDLSEKGRSYVMRFSWDVTAKRLSNMLSQIER